MSIWLFANAFWLFLSEHLHLNSAVHVNELKLIPNDVLIICNLELTWYILMIRYKRGGVKKYTNYSLTASFSIYSTIIFTLKVQHSSNIRHKRPAIFPSKQIPSHTKAEPLIHMYMYHLLFPVSLMTTQIMYIMYRMIICVVVSLNV